MNGFPRAAERPVAGPAALQIVAKRQTYADGFHIEPHWHERAQFLFAVKGTMAVRTARCAWIVPSSRALWIPSRAIHEIEMQGEVEMRTVYLHPRVTADLWPECVVLEVTPLLRELIVRAADESASEERDHSALTSLLVAEIHRLRTCAFDLPLPQSADLMRLCESTMADLAERRSDRADAAQVSQSARTVYRRFLKETGISFARWKQQARLLEAIRRLSGTAAVTTVAFDLGYQSPGAFSTMFRRALGVAPRDFIRETREGKRA
ncbi:MAG: AraC family transcriptional regulator [Burkholderiaceae bacterium]